MEKGQIKSRQRVADHGEVFTGNREVKAMCDMVGDETYRIESRVLEPACGDGNFLAELLERRLETVTKNVQGTSEWTVQALTALSMLYGVDILDDNVAECRKRLTELWMTSYEAYTGKGADNAVCSSVKRILSSNIICADTLTMTTVECGSLSFTEWMVQGESVTAVRRIPMSSLMAEERKNDGQLWLFEELDGSRRAEKDFRFNLIIGNPPYQESDGGAQSSARPIYQLFIRNAKRLEPDFLTMITPSRWFTGGKFLDEFRQDNLNDDRICCIHDFPHAEECFPGVDIKGGVNYFLWRRDHHAPCHIYTHMDGKVVSDMVRPLLEPGLDFFIRYSEAVSVVRKVRGREEKSFAEMVHSAMCFGLRTHFRKFDSDSAEEGYVKVYANHAQGYILQAKVKKNRDYIDRWKVIVPEAIGSGDPATDCFRPIVCAPGEINTETYVMNGPWKDRTEAENVAEYMKTKFFRFLVGLKKITQHATWKVYSLVPMQDFSRPWTDEELYAKYGLSDEEIAFIERTVCLNNKDTEKNG